MCIYINNLSKSYTNKPRRLSVGGLFGIRTSNLALRNINLNIGSGECVGVIGKNGSGKSTLLKIICGITAPTEGEIRVNGKISSLLELGAGFNPEYTGISNIYLTGAIQGLSKKEIRALVPQIAEFADIGAYIERPVKTYSDGMFLRLAFATAIATNPDILIIDEALAVGDFAFRQKCFSKIESMKKSGVTVIMVSHDIDAIRRLCSRTIWLDDGKLIKDSDTASVSAMYMESMTGNAPSVNLDTLDKKGEFGSCLNRFGSAVGSVLSVEVPPVQQTDKPSKIMCRLNIPSGANLDNMAFSVSFKNSFGLDLSVISSADCGIRFKRYGICELAIRYVCHLCPGEYSLCVSLEDRSQTPIKYYDYAEGVSNFRVVADREYFGVFHTPAEMIINEQTQT